MALSNSNLARQVALLTLLLNRRDALTRDELQAMLPAFYPPEKAGEALKKMFDRDIEALQAQGFAVVTRSRGTKEGYLLLPEDPSLLVATDFALSAAEAKALAQALQDPGLSAQMPALARLALSRLLAFHAPLDAPEALSAEDKKETALITRLVEYANRGQAVEIDFPSSSTGLVEHRVVSPHGIDFYRGKAYLAALCHRDCFPKVFTVAKIKALRLSHADYKEAPEGTNWDQWFSQNRERYFTQRQAKVCFAASEAWRAQQEHAWAITDTQPDGSVIAEFPVLSADSFYAFMLQFGAGVRILAPQELRQGFCAFLGGR
jgi:predicted DNA-binding transcriptional regulator YafY